MSTGEFRFLIFPIALFHRELFALKLSCLGKILEMVGLVENSCLLPFFLFEEGVIMEESWLPLLEVVFRASFLIFSITKKVSL